MSVRDRGNTVNTKPSFKCQVKHRSHWCNTLTSMWIHGKTRIEIHWFILQCQDKLGTSGPKIKLMQGTMCCACAYSAHSQMNQKTTKKTAGLQLSYVKILTPAQIFWISDYKVFLCQQSFLDWMTHRWEFPDACTVISACQQCQIWSKSLQGQ